MLSPSPPEIFWSLIVWISGPAPGGGINWFELNNCCWAWLLWWFARIEFDEEGDIGILFPITPWWWLLTTPVWLLMKLCLSLPITLPGVPTTIPLPVILLNAAAKDLPLMALQTNKILFLITTRLTLPHQPKIPQILFRRNLAIFPTSQIIIIKFFTNN